ncbi:transposase family protein [[Clostridium] spiroforme]|nr:transposase family protein [Thomasclavelia spiroformis]
MSQAYFLITLKIKDHICPHCRCFAHYVKDYRTWKLKHNVFVNFSSTIFYRQKRYLCRNYQKTLLTGIQMTSTIKQTARKERYLAIFLLKNISR